MIEMQDKKNEIGWWLRFTAPINLILFFPLIWIVAGLHFALLFGSVCLMQFLIGCIIWLTFLPTLKGRVSSQVS